MLRHPLFVLTAFAVGCVLLWACGDPQIDGPIIDHPTAAFDDEFTVRPDGYPGLTEAYGFSFAARPKQMDAALMYQAVANGQVDVICGFATDGRIPAYDLRILDDDKGFFPPYHAAPLVRAETLAEYPQLREVLTVLGGTITDTDMQTLNYKVDEKQQDAAAVAHDFLHAKGLIQAPAEGTERPEPEGTIVVGGKNFTEQDILCELMAQLIEDRLPVTVERKRSLGGTMICFNALRSGDLDCYAEYTGTGLVNILDREVIDDPDRVYAEVEQAFAKEYELVWLEPFGFNNTYTLTMREAQAEKLGIESISDLAAHVNQLQGVDHRIETEPDTADAPDAEPGTAPAE